MLAERSAADAAGGELSADAVAVEAHGQWKRVGRSLAFEVVWRSCQRLQVACQLCIVWPGRLSASLILANTFCFQSGASFWVRWPLRLKPMVRV